MENALENKIEICESKIALFVIAVIDVIGLAYLIYKTIGVI